MAKDPKSPSEMPAGGISLKGGPAPLAQRGIRVAATGHSAAGATGTNGQGSAAAAPGSNGRSTPPATPRATAVHAEATAQRRVEFSQIKGLSQDVRELTEGEPTRLGRDLFAGSYVPERRISVVWAVVLLAAVIGGSQAVPKVRQRTQHLLAQAKAEVARFIRKRHPGGMHLAEDLDLKPDAGRAVAPAAEAPVMASSVRCQLKVQEAQTPTGPMLTSKRIDLAECYLLAEDPLHAAASLSDLGAKIRRTPPAELAGKNSLGEAMLVLQSALLKQGSELAASQLIGSACVAWQHTTPCIAKLMLNVARKIPVGGEISALLNNRQQKLGAKSEAYLSLAAAQAAAQAGNPALSDRRFDEAIASAPNSALALRKEIYEAQAMDLYQRGAAARVKATVDQGLRELALADRQSGMKLKLLAELAAAGTQRKALHTVLSREDLKFRIRGDVDFVDLVGPPALRAGLAADYLGLVHRTRDYYASKYHTHSGATRRLMIWEVRADLAANDSNRALSLLSAIANDYGDDALTHHLRGTAFANLASKPLVQVQAAQEFQAAVKLGHDWESLYGLGMALVHAGKLGQVPALIADLSKMMRSKGQRYWLDMLRAELALALGKYAEAQGILKPWASAEPPWVSARSRMLQVYQKTGRTLEAQRLQTSLAYVEQQQPFATSFEGIASPLGCMALARRPLD